VAKGEDLDDLERRMLARLNQRGARYPAEHNVGHPYSADRPLAGFYKSLDPGNRFNAGIGLMSKNQTLSYRAGR
jgi:D-lactate dehydrogenase